MYQVLTIQPFFYIFLLFLFFFGFLFFGFLFFGFLFALFIQFVQKPDFNIFEKCSNLRPSFRGSFIDVFGCCLNNILFGWITQIQYIE
ncbi:MAG: hypothetical protein FJX80_04170 [Bacteroidetes bacterium]|nr:hypothetical protein [Bacteroidota bacterium]